MTGNEQRGEESGPKRVAAARKRIASLLAEFKSAKTQEQADAVEAEADRYFDGLERNDKVTYEEVYADIQRVYGESAARDIAMREGGDIDAARRRMAAMESFYSIVAKIKRAKTHDEWKRALEEKYQFLNKLSKDDPGTLEACQHEFGEVSIKYLPAPLSPREGANPRGHAKEEEAKKKNKSK